MRDAEQIWPEISYETELLPNGDVRFWDVYKQQWCTASSRSELGSIGRVSPELEAHIAKMPWYEDDRCDAWLAASGDMDDMGQGSAFFSSGAMTRMDIHFFFKAHGIGGHRIAVKTPYNKNLITRIKAMDGRLFDSYRHKEWSVPEAHAEALIAAVKDAFPGYAYQREIDWSVALLQEAKPTYETMVVMLKEIMATEDGTPERDEARKAGEAKLDGIKADLTERHPRAPVPWMMEELAADAFRSWRDGRR